MQESPPKKQILIVEDDQKLGRLLCQYLEKNNYQAYQSQDYKHAQQFLNNKKIDFVILDIMLPGINGFEICREIRKTSQVPILFLSARGETTDKVVGLEMGGDDYLSKPFEPRELLARLEAIFRRTQQTYEKIITVGELKIDFKKNQVFLKDAPLALTYLEYEMLALFVKNRGEILDREYILEKLYNLEWDGMNRSVDVLIGRLRKKIKDNNINPLIRTIWGRGYAME